MHQIVLILHSYPSRLHAPVRVIIGKSSMSNRVPFPNGNAISIESRVKCALFETPPGHLLLQPWLDRPAASAGTNLTLIVGMSAIRNQYYDDVSVSLFRRDRESTHETIN
jgi:hypothetical protein